MQPKSSQTQVRTPIIPFQASITEQLSLIPFPRKALIYLLKLLYPYEQSECRKERVDSSKKSIKLEKIYHNNINTHYFRLGIYIHNKKEKEKEKEKHFGKNENLFHRYSFNFFLGTFFP